MGWVFLEIGIALALAIALVWWTLPRKPRGDERGSGDAGKDER